MNKIIGMSVEDAEKFAQENGYTMRIVIQDGEHFIVTMDFRSNRLNVEVEDNVVVNLINIG